MGTTSKCWTCGLAVGATLLASCSPSQSSVGDPLTTMCLEPAKLHRVEVSVQRGSATNDEVLALLTHVAECEQGSPNSKRKRVIGLISELQRRGDHRADPLLEYGDYSQASHP